MEAVEEAKRDLAHKVIFAFENRRKVNQQIVNSDIGLPFTLLGRLLLPGEVS
jgi:hypothetical protein